MVVRVWGGVGVGGEKVSPVGRAYLRSTGASRPDGGTGESTGLSFPRREGGCKVPHSS